MLEWFLINSSPTARGFNMAISDTVFFSSLMNIHHFGLHNKIWKGEKLYNLHDTDQLYIIFKMSFNMAMSED